GLFLKKDCNINEVGPEFPKSSEKLFHLFISTVGTVIPFHNFVKQSTFDEERQGIRKRSRLHPNHDGKICEIYLAERTLRYPCRCLCTRRRRSRLYHYSKFAVLQRLCTNGARFVRY